MNSILVGLTTKDNKSCHPDWYTGDQRKIRGLVFALEIVIALLQGMPEMT
jgi:hypothetical protein